MKPEFFRHFPLALVLYLLTSQFASAQSCGEARTPALVAYLQYKGAGWEMGWWPASSGIGFFGGMSISRQQIETSGKDSSTEIMGTEVYGKLQFRLYERVALTATGGLLNGQRLYYGAGLRFNFPLSDRTAIVGEPQVSSEGFNLQLGAAKRF